LVVGCGEARCKIFYLVLCKKDIGNESKKQIELGCDFWSVAVCRDIDECHNVVD
jgi:hypothetical protein